MKYKNLKNNCYLHFRKKNYDFILFTIHDGHFENQYRWKASLIKIHMEFIHLFLVHEQLGTTYSSWIGSIHNHTKPWRFDGVSDVYETINPLNQTAGVQCTRNMHKRIYRGMVILVTHNMIYIYTYGILGTCK